MDEKKVREAIELIKQEIQTLEDLGEVVSIIEEKKKKHIELYNTVIEALEKQLPKKVEVKEWSPARCPSCGTELSESLGDGYYRHSTFLKRCPNVDCGQRLDWSEE